MSFKKPENIKKENKPKNQKNLYKRKKSKSLSESDEEIKFDPIALDGKQEEIEFLFLGIQENMFSSLEILMSLYCKGFSQHSSELTDALINQPELGIAIVNQEEEKDQEIFSFLSIILMDLLKNFSIYNDIQKFITSYCKDQLNKLDIGNLGLLVNERSINLPETLVPDAFKQLNEDFEWISKQNFEHKNEFVYKKLIYFTKVYKNCGKQKKIKTENDGYFFYKVEDEIFLKVNYVIRIQNIINILNKARMNRIKFKNQYYL